jgi:hypothetical protein
MATGEVVDAETLGGADMHSRVSGLLFSPRFFLLFCYSHLFL